MREKSARSQRIADQSRARTMLLVVVCLFASAAAGPVLYDQRQNGEKNGRVDISNVLLLFTIPKGLPNTIADIFSKSEKSYDKEHDIQDRADVRVMEAFVEPNTPYRVEIGSDERSVGDGRAVEVVIAGRRRLETDPIEAQDVQATDSQTQEAQAQDDLKLLGATENCGPGRVRDSVTLLCKDVQEPAKVNAEPETQMDQQKVKEESQATPEVVPL